MNKQYKLRGINDDHNTCEVCGKTNLKKVMWLSEITKDGEVLDPFAAGTTCGSKMLGISGSKQIKERKIQEIAKNQINKAVDELVSGWFVRRHRDSGPVYGMKGGNLVPPEMFKTFCEVSLVEFLKLRNEKYPLMNSSLPIEERIKYAQLKGSQTGAFFVLVDLKIVNC